MRHTSKTRSFFLLMGLVLSTMLLLGVVSATSSTPSITVTAPNGGETWQRGTSHTVTWDYTGSPGSTVKILLLKSGTEVGTIASSTPTGSGGKGSYSWPVSSSGSTGSDYKVSVQSISQASVKDTSNNYFTITPATTTPTITVTSPNGGESWKRGTSHTVTWDYTGSPGSTVKILLLKSGNEVGTIASSTPTGSGGKGSYSWPVYPSGSTGSDYKVSVQSISQASVKDTSNNYFTITSATTTPVITPSSPSTPVVTQTDNAITRSGSSTLYLDQFGIKGDGTDETAKLQSALNYARDHSIHTVVFPQNKIIAISSMVRIWGGLTVVGNGATIKRKDYTAIYPGSMVSVWDGAHVSGLIIDGNYWADDYGNPENYADNGVILGSNVVFDNNEVKNVRAYSIEVYGDSNVVITNNKIHDSYQYGIDTGGGVGGESYNITVTGNTIYNCQQVGIKIRGTHGAVIRNNTITMPENSQFARGISLYSFDLPNDDILIDGNTITGSFKGGNMDGISSDDSHNTKIRITNNIVSKCDVGIDLHFTGGTVTGNKISECSTSIAGAGGNVVANTILTSGNPPNSEQTPVVTPTATSPVIKPPTSSITVTAPNGGETWKQGTSNTITWSYTGSPGSTVKIELLKGSTPVGAIAESVPIGSGGKGTYSWPISSIGTTGSDYKVSVQSTSQPSISDMSNNYFTVTAGTAISTTTTPSTTPTPVSTTNTIVISSSSALYLDQFGIKGDGTDETAKLQSAFNYARDHSIRTVVFPQNKVITITSMVRIWGGTTVVGNGATLKRKAYASMYPGSMLSVWDGARVSGLIIDGNYWTDDYGNPETYSDNGVILGDNVVFDNNEVKNVRAYSVQVYGDSNVIITNNKIHDSYQYGITTGGGVGGESHNITVTGNTIYNCQQVGIKIRGTHGAVIRNNKITMPENSQFTRGISLYSFDLPNEDILIDGNTIIGSFKGGNMDGISSDDSQNTKIRITNNIVSKCDVGIDLHFTGGTITENKISECSTSIAGASGNIVANNILT